MITAATIPVRGEHRRTPQRRLRFRFVERYTDMHGVDQYVWQRPLDSRVEQVIAPVSWFWREKQQ